MVLNIYPEKILSTIARQKHESIYMWSGSIFPYNKTVVFHYVGYFYIVLDHIVFLVLWKDFNIAYKHIGDFLFFSSSEKFW